MSEFNTVISDFLEKIDNILDGYVYSGYQGLSEYLAAPLGAAIVLFFVFYGLAISQGWVKGSVSSMTRSLFKIGLIYYLAMNWANFSEYVYDIFYKASGEIGASILNNSPVSLKTITNDSTINGALQYVLNEIAKICGKLFGHGGPFNISSWFFAGLIALSGAFFIAFSLLEIVIAKCMLSILFVVAPLFISFTLFEVTQTFFDRWLGACVSYASLMIFIGAGLGLVLSLDQWILSFYIDMPVEDISIADMCAFVLITLICISIIRRISLLALSIGGTVSTISGEESFATGVGALVAGGVFIKSAADYVRNSSSDKNNNINDRDRYLKDKVSNEGNHGNHYSSVADRSRFMKQNDNDNNSDYTQGSTFREKDEKRYHQNRRKDIRFHISQSNNRKNNPIESDYD